MSKKNNENRAAYKKLLNEIHQTPPVRQALIKELENYFNKTVITFFTSFTFPVMIEDEDAKMIEEVLQNTELNSNGLVLILNSPGGSGLAAERIINVCRAYSNDCFEVVVPNMAKSAATMICMGSNHIYMSKTSELGPIDPQVTIVEDGTRKVFSVHGIINSFETLLKKATKEINGRVEPYLQQLQRYDSRLIEDLRRAQELSESIAIKYLKLGMMSKEGVRDIRKKIKPFLSPLETKSHGRPIFFKQAIDCGLKVSEIELDSEQWHKIWELYLRTDHLLNRDIAKVIESKNDHFYSNINIKGD
ncbi:MAG: hypothetical protein NTX22_16650 [Ignavibacteriales bacterium]|nr:hypothetical protein [Ignavibacteriales bacterium]